MQVWFLQFWRHPWSLKNAPTESWKSKLTVLSGLLKERNRSGHRPTVTRSSKNWTVNTARRGIFFSAQKCASSRLAQNVSHRATAPSVMRLSTFVTKSQNVSQPVQTRSNRFSPVNQSLPALTIILTMIVRVQVFSTFSVLIEKNRKSWKKSSQNEQKIYSLLYR